MNRIPRFEQSSAGTFSLFKIVLLLLGVIIDWQLSMPIFFIVVGLTQWQKDHVKPVVLLSLFLLACLYDVYLGWWLGVTFTLLVGWHLAFVLGRQFAVQPLVLTTVLSVFTTGAVQFFVWGKILTVPLFLISIFFIFLQSLTQHIVQFYSSTTS